MQHLAIDFEYIEEQDKTRYNLICCVIFDMKTLVIQRFDLRASNHELEIYMSGLDPNQVRFYGYAITNAEVPILCQIMGVEWVKVTNWVDLWTEFKMFSKSHNRYFSIKDGLSACMQVLKIEDKYTVDKSEMRNLILYDETERKRAEKDRKLRIQTGTFNYTDEEIEKILFYCEQDVVILLTVYEKLKEISKKYPITIQHWIKRGEHCKFAGIAHHQMRGYPMDVKKLTAIFSNIEKIENRIAKSCNEQVGHEIYEAQYRGPQRNKIFVKYSFNMENFTNYIKEKGLYESWEKTENGKLKLEEAYLDVMLSNFKDILEPIYFARNTKKQLNSTNLLNLLTPDGFIKGLNFPFNQKTSRTSPLPSKGFILNLTPWIRMLIHPEPGHSFVGIDFKSQEVLVAALISGDDSMLEDYQTDIYMGQAIKTGFAPVNATKKTHPELRKGFKPISLGVSYLMGANTLSIRFKDLYKLIGQEKTLRQCKDAADIFLKKYKKVYYKYSNFVDKHFKTSRKKGFFQSLDNWFYFVDTNTRETQLQNVPCQSAGAAMTREAHDRCVKDGIYPIMLHDALYFYCQESDAVELSKTVSRHMCEASRDLLGADYMQTETTIFTHDMPYYDPRGEHIYKIIMSELEINCPDTFNKPKEILDIHKVT